MRKSFPVEDLARDDRFVRVPMTERFNDPRTAQVEQRQLRQAQRPRSPHPRPPRRARRRPRR